MYSHKVDMLHMIYHTIKLIVMSLLMPPATNKASSKSNIWSYKFQQKPRERCLCCWLIVHFNSTLCQGLLHTFLFSFPVNSFHTLTTSHCESQCENQMNIQPWVLTHLDLLCWDSAHFNPGESKINARSVGIRCECWNQPSDFVIHNSVCNQDLAMILI